jgi:hypothetical protein
MEYQNASSDLSFLVMPSPAHVDEGTVFQLRRLRFDLVVEHSLFLVIPSEEVAVAADESRDLHCVGTSTRPSDAEIRFICEKDQSAAAFAFGNKN